MTHQKICKVAIWQMFPTLSGVSFYKNNLYGLKGGCHNIFKAVNLPTNWLKIPKSVNVTDFPIEQLFKYPLYLAEMCFDSKDEVLVDGRSWPRSCRLPVGVVGVVGTFLLPFYLASFPVRIPIQSSVLSANDTVTSSVMFFL